MFWVVSSLMRLVCLNGGYLLSNCLGKGNSQKAETFHLLYVILFSPFFSHRKHQEYIAQMDFTTALTRAKSRVKVF